MDILELKVRIDNEILQYFLKMKKNYKTYGEFEEAIEKSLKAYVFGGIERVTFAKYVKNELYRLLEEEKKALFISK